MLKAFKQNLSSKGHNNLVAYRYIVQSVNQKQDILLLTLTPKGRRNILQFEPGQYATIRFQQGLRPTPTRCFSLISPPSSSVLQFALKIEGNFTQAAARLRPGDSVKVQGPFGNFTINPEYDRNIVMLASGIGITPFLSMLRDIDERQVKPHVTLLYSNRSSTNIPFKEQLQTLAQRNPNLRIELFSGDTTGKITEQHILDLVSAHGKQTTYFICGTASFTQRMQTTLASLGVYDNRIISESFAQAVPAAESGVSLRMLTYGLSAALMTLLTAGIMLLDLNRNLSSSQAKATAARAPSTKSSNASIATSSSTSQSQATPSTTSQNNSESSNYTTYQSPTSSVS